MQDGLDTLSEREKQALRLLLRGHDAKSVARLLDLSVHTVNERLRDARRKLGLSSSREAARLLAQAEQDGPDFLGDTKIGGDAGRGAVPAKRPRLAARSAAAWFAGGGIVMSVTAAVLVFSLLAQGAADTGRSPAASGGALVAEDAGSRSARAWLALVDGGRFAESWSAAGAVFKSQVNSAQWRAAIEPIRRPLGKTSSRVLQSATRAASLPGAPAGQYELLQFRTRFAGRPEVIETVTLSYEAGAWKVVGYFIR